MPLPKKLKKTIKKFAKRDRKLGKKFHPYTDKPGNFPLYILSRHGRDGIEYHILGIVEDWSAEFEKFRAKTLFSVSTIREDFGAESNETFFQIIKRASHVGKPNGEIYALKDGDTVQAFQYEFAYKFYGIEQGQITFDLSKAINEPA